jgi:hypothetical protein
MPALPLANGTSDEFMVGGGSIKGALMSALPPKADIDRRERHVRFVPKADIPRCSEDRR